MKCISKIVALVTLTVSGCGSQPITSAPISNAPLAREVLSSNPDFVAGVKEVEFNLRNGAEVGTIKKDNRALKCAQAFLAQENAGDVKGFVPQTSTPLGEASALYLREQQVEAAKSGGVFDVECEALMWRLLMRVGRGAERLVPGAALLR